MPSIVKFLLLAIPVLGVGMFFGYQDHLNPERFVVEGKVISINWQSRNHGMPVIEIKPKVGATKIFSSNRITLRPELLAIGDSFSKSKNSKFCNINGVGVQCVN